MCGSWRTPLFAASIFARGTASAPRNAGSAAPGGNPPNPTMAATQTLASRTGALSDEINFPSFVAALVHGTFDAIVDPTIRQMEAFADLVSAVAKDLFAYPLDLTIAMAERLHDWLASRNSSQSLYEILPGLFDASFKHKNPEQVMRFLPVTEQRPHSCQSA